MSGELPEGWATARLGELGHWYGGGTPSKRKPSYWTNGDIPWVSPKDMKTPVIASTEDNITATAVQESSTKLVPHPSILVVTRSGILNRTLPVALTSRSVTLNQDLKAINPHDGVVPRYLAGFLRSRDLDIRESCGKDGTTVASIDTARLQAYETPLPPLNEQRRIVAKLDALQSHSRKARAALDAIPTLLDRFRQSVLAAAFRGDLTADWRAAHPDVEPATALLARIRVERKARWIADYIDTMTDRARKRAEKKGKAWTGADEAKARKGYAKKAEERYEEPAPVDAEKEGLPELPEGWCWTTLGFAAPLLAGYAFSSSGFRARGRRLLKGNNVRDGWLFEDELHHWDPNDTEQYSRYLLREGDIVLAMDRPVYSSGSKRTKIARLTADWDGALLLQRVGRFQPESGLDASFLFTFLSGHLFRDHLIGRQTGTQDGKDLPHVSASMVHACPLPLPPAAEQAHICRLVAKWLGFAATVEECAPSTGDLSRINQSILAKAFRGELVPQNPSDEPAADLLARIQAESTAAAPAKTRRTRRTPT